MTEPLADEVPAQKEALDRYAAGPELLGEAVSGLTEEQLDLSCPGTVVGSWTIRQLAHHIVDGDDLWNTPVKMALGQPAAVFSLEWYWSRPQDEWAGCWDYAGRALAPSLALFRANRRHILELLEHRSGAWDLTVDVRWSDGSVERVSVADLVRSQAGHASGHIGDILQIRREHGI